MQEKRRIRLCGVLTQSMIPCRMPAMRGQTTCFNHSPDPLVARRRLEARRLGGKHRWPPKDADRAKRRRRRESLSARADLGDMTPREFLRAMEPIPDILRLLYLDVDAVAASAGPRR